MLRAAIPVSRRALAGPAPALRHAHFSTARLVRKDANTKPSVQDHTAAVLPGSNTTDPSADIPNIPKLEGRLHAAQAVKPPPTDGKVLPEATVKIPPPPTAEHILAAKEAAPTHPPSGRYAPDSAKPGHQPYTPPEIIKEPVAPASSTITPVTPPTPPPKRRSRLGRLLLTLIVLSGLSFAGGVWYSTVSDNFHDFFTEYVPFGEQAVLYVEEREFRKRFPRTLPVRNTAQDKSEKITIPSKSGASSRVISTVDEVKGPHNSATNANTAQGKENLDKAQQVPGQATPKEKTKTVERAKKEAPSGPSTPKKSVGGADSSSEPPKGDIASSSAPSRSDPAPHTGKAPTSKPSTSTESQTAKSQRSPEVNEPSVFMPIPRIDPLKIKDADEPLVQDLVGILNDIITVVNNDNSTGKYTSTITKAKTSLADVGKRIIALKESEKNAAAAEIKAKEQQFDDAAKDLLRRLTDTMEAKDAKLREDFEAERKAIEEHYEKRLATEAEQIKKIMDSRLKNQLLEQAMQLKKRFSSDIKDQVESERNGRLARLAELSSGVDELEKLTGQWNTVIDANLKTQHLQVAVEAVRASLERTDRPRPFVRELATLKELASDDSVINSAIASINPSAYQFGVPTTAQLIDRFRRVSTEVRKASLLDDGSGLAAHASSFVLSRLMFKKSGRAVGDDVESVLTRTETLLEEGNFDEAAREMNSLTGWAKTLSQDWLNEVRKSLEVKQALEVIATQARLQSLTVD